MASRATLALSAICGCVFNFAPLIATALAPHSTYEGQRIVDIRFDPPRPRGTGIRLTPAQW
jgi:hypothetical protein